jgi:hypothetical protein
MSPYLIAFVETPRTAGVRPVVCSIFARSSAVESDRAATASRNGTRVDLLRGALHRRRGHLRRQRDRTQSFFRSACTSRTGSINVWKLGNDKAGLYPTGQRQALVSVPASVIAGAVQWASAPAMR